MSLQGTLRTLGIAEVLEFLAGRSATGRLEITADTGHATYWVSSGEIASVVYSFAREAGTDAAEATYYALAEVEGTFHFDEDQRPEDVEDTEAISDVLARTADTADGWSYVEEVIASPQHWLSRSETLEDTVAVQPDWWVAIAAVGDGITPQKLAQSLDMRALAASTMASDMVRAGLLEVGEPRSEAAEAAPVADAVTEDAEAPAGDAAETDHDGLNLFGAGAPPVPESDGDASAELDELVSELESQSTPEPDVAPAPLTVVEPLDDSIESNEDHHGAPAPTAEAGPSSWPEVEPPAEHQDAPASPALVWDAEAAPEPDAPADGASPGDVAASEFGAPESGFGASDSAFGAPDSAFEAPAGEFDAPAGEPVAAPAETGGDWDDDDGWATDHAQPATVSMGAAEEYSTAPAAADVFGAAPAVDPSAMPADFGDEGSGETPDDYATDDRSSVLKFLRRD